MFIQSKIIKLGTVLLSLFLTMQTALAADAELCAPFKNTKVDQSLISTMLKAAENGYMYQIKDNSSTMGFCVESSIGIVRGDFENFQGGIALEGTDAQTLISVDVSSLESNVLFIDSLLKGEDFFNIDHFPKLVFVSSETVWTSDTRAVVKGELTMHGVTKTIAFYVEITEIDGDLSGSDSILVKATTTVKRSEFGMNALSSMVNDKVNLCMTVEAERYISAL